VVALVLFWRMPESPRWLEARQRRDQARRITERMEARVMKRHPVLPEPDLTPHQVVAEEKKRWLAPFGRGYLAVTVFLLVVMVLGYGGIVYGSVGYAVHTTPALVAFFVVATVGTTLWQFSMWVYIPGNYYGSLQSLADQGVVACQACAFVEPARSCLVTPPPLEPVSGVARRGRALEGSGEQPLDFPDGERDKAGIGRRPVVRPGRRGSLGVGAALELGGGDGADREGGHDQDDVPQDGGVEPGLALIEAEAALGELEALLGRPPQTRGPDQPGLGRELPFGHVAVAEGEFAGLQVAADQQ
jgi:hypothetical protein